MHDHVFTMQKLLLYFEGWVMHMNKTNSPPPQLMLDPSLAIMSLKPFGHTSDFLQLGSYVMLPVHGMYPTPSTAPLPADGKQVTSKPPSPTQIYPEEPLEENKVTRIFPRSFKPRTDEQVFLDKFYLLVCTRKN